MPRQHLSAILVNLNLPHRLESRSLKPEIEAAYTGEQGTNRQHSHLLSSPGKPCPENRSDCREAIRLIATANTFKERHRLAAHEVSLAANLRIHDVAAIFPQLARRSHWILQVEILNF
jgi:hypothetical protein